jgi:uncharacterized protein YndB with AHSA1/START domain
MTEPGKYQYDKLGPSRVIATKPQRVWTVLLTADSDKTWTAANMVTEHHCTREKHEDDLLGQNMTYNTINYYCYNYYICI